MKPRTWTGLGLALAALVMVGSAFAQGEVIPRRTDPGDPVIPELGGPSPWSIVQITGQAPGSTLGSLVVQPDGSVFVWSMHREFVPVIQRQATPTGEISPRRTDPANPQFPAEGGGGDPIVPLQYVTVSTLYQYNGYGWMPSLVLNGETGAFVYQALNGDLYANTNLPDGSMRVYHKIASGWRQESLPEGTLGPAGAFAGETNVFMRTGGYILRHAGSRWVVEMMCDDFAISGGLADVGGGQIMAPCPGHEHIFDGRRWFENDESFATQLHSVWGGRDANGVLHLFAAGTNPAHTDMIVYQYVESRKGTMAGQFKLCLQDPATAVLNVAGYATTVWGESVHEVYATGLAHGVGHLYLFNGSGWASIAPNDQLPATVDVAGTECGGLWVSLADGRMLHRAGTGFLPGDVTPPSPPVMPDPNGGGNVVTSSALEVRGGPASFATLEFTLPEARNVSMTFFDVSGRRVDGMDAGLLSAGLHRVNWNAARFPSGLYFCRLQAGPQVMTSKVLIQK